VPILKPTLVIALRGNPCLQVATGQGFTLAVTRAGEVFSWGCNSHGQLGQGNTQEEFRPRRIEQFDESNPVAQVSIGVCHSLAVTKSGQLFSWGYGSNYCLGHDDFLSELRPKRIEHGGFDDLFITSVVAGDEHSAAIDSSGYVCTSCSVLASSTFKNNTICHYIFITVDWGLIS
jgi:alpha-tubulin suppressor-like RCC1 family protein